MGQITCCRRALAIVVTFCVVDQRLKARLVADLAVSAKNAASEQLQSYGKSRLASIERNSTRRTGFRGLNGSLPGSGCARQSEVWVVIQNVPGDHLMLSAVRS
jgi:hypothetical protein